MTEEGTTRGGPRP